MELGVVNSADWLSRCKLSQLICCLLIGHAQVGLHLVNLVDHVVELFSLLTQCPAGVCECVLGVAHHADESLTAAERSVCGVCAHGERLSPEVL